MKHLICLFAALILSVSTVWASPSHGEESGEIDVKEIIFHHLGDGYGWEVPFSHVYRIPLPVIVRAEDGAWFCFSSDKLSEIQKQLDPATGKEETVSKAVVYTVERNAKTYRFTVAHEGDYANKVVQLLEPDEAKLDKVKYEISGLKSESAVDEGAPEADGYVLEDNQYWRQYRPLDLSITKNVLGLFIAGIIVCAMVFSLKRHYTRKGMKAPRKGLGFVELTTDFIYTGVVKGTLGSKARKFGPYLLTCFFFILTMNLLGLIVIFPGGANLTGNIAVTMVLALATFLMTNLLAKKHYWKEIFWPDVPLWLKCPIPIMQVIEVFGIFTKPAALCVRLFANMMGGHMIVITLTLLIFIFAAFGAGALAGSIVISILFSVFMLALDVLVSFIQAYVFTLLSSLFIALAQEEGHEEHEEIEGHEVTVEPDIEPV